MTPQAEHAQTKKGSIHKLSITQKEIVESIYWLELLKVTDYLVEKEFQSLHYDAVEVIKIITALLKTSKLNG